MENVCPQCGGGFAPKPGKKYCTRKCTIKANNTRWRRARLPQGQPAQRSCAHCGRSFVAKSRDRIYCYERYCAQSAYQDRMAAGIRRVMARKATCDGCGTLFETVRPEARWCSKRCANRHWGRVRARQRGKPSEAKYTDREIFERDGWRCHLCGKPVRRDVHRLHPEGATIDHLIPQSRGGDDERPNVATAHWKCNHRKGVRAQGEQLALI